MRNFELLRFEVLVTLKIKTTGHAASYLAAAFRMNLLPQLGCKKKIMNTGGVSETLVPTYKIARYYIPQENDLFIPRVIVPPCLCRNGK
jgi:hypothetical protein